MDKSKRTGRFLISTTSGETVKAYLPSDLPPNPNIKLSEKQIDLMQAASQSIGRLDGVSSMLPNIGLFTYMFMRKEALVSSQIEGTQSSFTDLMLYESDQSPGVPIEDVEEVVNYIAALNRGVQYLDNGYPISLRLIKEIHAKLLKGVRGQEKLPGEFRRSQNWIGGTRPSMAIFVPPPPEYVMDCMGALEKFIHDDPVKTSPLIKVALSHVQFETIHPFLDGNGRLGRLLIILVLYAESVLKYPSLYLSLYFKVNRDEYYAMLQNVRQEGDWESWIMFFLKALQETADQAVGAIFSIQKLFQKDETAVVQHGKSTKSVLEVYRHFQIKPMMTIGQCVEQLQSTTPTVTKAFQYLVNLKILKELTGRERNRIYSYEAYIKLLAKGADPISK